MTLLIVLVSVPLLTAWYFMSHPVVTPATYAGLTVMTISVVFFTIARIQLGASFQVSAKANKLVTTGLYKRIRHPVYLFGFLFLLGVVVLMQKYLLIIFLCAIILLQLKRIKKEEQVLEEKFGEEYRSYKKGTWF